MSTNTSLESIASADRPIIRHGAPSDSAVLSRFVDNILSDIIDFNQRITDLTTNLNTTTNIFITQQQAMDANMQSVSNLLDIGSSGVATDILKRAIIGFYTDQYLANVVNKVTATLTTTADINFLYGQATLPIAHVYEKLVAIDLGGQRYIPEMSRISVATSPTQPTSDSAYVEDPKADFALDGRPDTVWSNTGTKGDTIWVRIEVPPILNANRLTNAISMQGFPTMAHSLIGVWTRTPGGSWVDTQGLLYQDDYTLSNKRILIDPTPVAEVLIAFMLGTSEVWGFTDLSVQYLDFKKTGELDVDFVTFSNNIPIQATLRGRNEPALSFLTRTIVGTQVQVALTQQTVGTSPLIRLVEVRYAP